MTSIEDSLSSGVDKSNDANLHHFCTRLWERHGIAGTPDIIDKIYSKIGCKSYQGKKHGRRIYKFYLCGKFLEVWTTDRKKLYTVI